jgi:hypothetical protein
MRMACAMEIRASWTQGCLSDDDGTVEVNGGSKTDIMPVAFEETESPGNKRRREARDIQYALAGLGEYQHA